jgi:hypothetical protein
VPDCDTIVDSCNTTAGKRNLIMGRAGYMEKAGIEATLNVDSTPHFRKKRWVIAVVTGVQGDEAALHAFSVALGVGAGTPFFFGHCGLEVFVCYRCQERDRHKPKTFKGPGQTDFYVIRKLGSQTEKVFAVLDAFMSKSTSAYTNLAFTLEGASGSALEYEGALELVSDWGVERFTAYVNNAAIHKSRGQLLSALEQVCLISKASLLEVVRLRQDCSDDVFILGSPMQRAACPVPLDVGPTEYGKNLKLIVWSPTDNAFKFITTTEWIDGEEHLLCTLLLLGDGGLGKSKFMHMVAQELTIGAAKTQYVFSKGIDPLGILSHCGDIRKSGALVLTDFDFTTAHGKPLSSESLKSLLDVPEGGKIIGTRYRPCSFGPELARLIALNGAANTWGDWFTKNGEIEIGALISKIQLDDAGDVENLEAINVQARRLTSDARASLRRVCIGFVSKPLITEATKTQLRDDAKTRAAEQKKRREAFWSA